MSALAQRSLPRSLSAVMYDDSPVVTDAHRMAQFEQHMVAAMSALTRAKACIHAGENSSAVTVAHSAAWSARDAVLNAFRGAR